MVAILTALTIMVLYLIGGQVEKGVRRYGVPSIAVMFGMFEDRKKKFKEKWRLLALFLMIGVLSMGYGESSWLRKLCRGNDTLTRLAYAFLLTIIFTIAGGNILFCAPILIVAWQVRAGSLFHIGKYDVLIEDICRSLAIFFATYITIKGGI